MHKFIFVSDDFHKDYPPDKCPEIARKVDRPYIYVSTLINGVQFAVPFRSNINHKFVLWTDKTNNCGLDFSKAIVINNENYIDKNRKPHIREDEFNALRGKEHIINQKMASFINKYKNAKQKQNINANVNLCKCSTLQYFEEYI